MRALIAGGGTGGHVFPALAVAEALRAHDPQAEVLFVGTARGFEAEAVPAAGYPIELIRVSGLKRVGAVGRLRGMARLPGSFFSSWSILSRFNPDVVLGVGGYASGPVVMTACMRGIPTAICEQNSVPGFTNRVLGRFVRAVLASYEISAAYFDSDRFHLVGNPVRGALTEVSRITSTQGALKLLVLGGSQGARPLNERVPAGLARVAQQGVALRIQHQAGRHEGEAVAAAYRGLGVEAEVPAFIDDMAAAYAWADLAVARAGATTCAELTAIGLPAILVPFPQAADDHQTINARALAEGGAARLLPQSELNAETLAQAVLDLVAEGRRPLQEMAAAAARLGRPDAAARVVDALERLAGGERRW